MLHAESDPIAAWSKTQMLWMHPFGSVVYCTFVASEHWTETAVGVIGAVADRRRRKLLALSPMLVRFRSIATTGVPAVTVMRSPMSVCFSSEQFMFTGSDVPSHNCTDSKKGGVLTPADVTLLFS